MNINATEVTLFFSTLGAIAAVVGAYGIIWAARAFKFNTWLRAQEIYMDNKFYEARESVFGNWDEANRQPKANASPPDNDARLVCQKMDELARLADYLGEEKMIEVWGFQMAKSWLILKKFVKAKREKDGFNKWDAFERLTKKAITKYNLPQLPAAL